MRDQADMRITQSTATAVAVLALVPATAVAATIIGGPGNERLRGTNGPDHIDGNQGDDRIFGRGANDTLIGGGGNDLVGGGYRANAVAGDADHVGARGSLTRLFGGVGEHNARGRGSH